MLAQSDTLTLKKALDYIHTDQFRQILSDSTERQIEKELNKNKFSKKAAKHYRKERWSDITIWLDTNNCFIPYQIYFTIDTTKKMKSSGNYNWFYKIDTIKLQSNYISPNHEKCHHIIKLGLSFLENHIIQVEYFSGQYLAPFKKGMSNILSFQTNKNDSLTLISSDAIINN